MFCRLTEQIIDSWDKNSIPDWFIIPHQPHAELCPVCKGNGKVAEKDIYGKITEEQLCHGCGGLGWVKV